MLETLLTAVPLIALIMLVRMAYRRVARPVDLPNPVISQHKGEYKALLAPHLNNAQPLVESFIHTLHAQLNTVKLGEGKNSSTLCFKIYDEEAASHRQKFYLLAITLRGGVLYFQAVSPRARGSNDDGNLLKTVQEASSSALANVPSHGAYHAEMDQEIITALSTAVQNQSIVALLLTDHSKSSTTISA